MPTPGEQRALLFLGAVALLGGGVRLFGGDAPRPEPTDHERAGLAAQMAAVDSAAAAKRREREARNSGGKGGGRSKGGATGGRAPARAAKVDVDRATVEELDALPGVGPALAERIVADRKARGAFGSLEALDEVSGIGPTLIKRLSPHVTFSGPRRHSTATGSAGGAPARGRVVGLIGGRP